MLTRFLRFRPDGGGTGGAPAPAAAPAGDLSNAPLNNGDGDAPIERVVPQEPGTPASIGDASKAFRERLERAALAADAPAAAAPAPGAAADPAKPLRNPDGTFAPAAPAEGAAAADPAAPGDAADPLAAETPIEEGEPTLFVLKGEASRGETDIELDVTGLPAEVIERLQRSEKQGMRRAEFDGAMQKVRTERSDLDAVETEMRVDPAGFVLNRVAPSTRAELAETLLLDQWDHLAPLIEQLWTDDAARSQRIGKITTDIRDRQSNVVATVTASRRAADVRAAVSELVPENVSDDDAREFFSTSIALLQTKAMNNEPVTPADVPKLLAAHRRRFFGAGEPAASPTPAARPKLAVRQPPSAVTKPAGSPATSAAPVVSQEEIARRAKARTGALAAAPQGAGAGAVQRPGGPANETIEQASKRLRAQRTG